MKSICFWPILFIAVLIANPVHATVINFDDLTTPTNLTVTNYAGLTWGKAPQPWEGDWTVGSDASGNAIPHSSPNFVFNGRHSDAMWFEFPAPVTIFNGAWFSQFGTEFVTKISMGDDQSNGTGWVTLTATPQFLAADWSNTQRVTIYRISDPFGESPFYAMDDITFNESLQPVPEPATMLLLGSGLIGLAGYGRKKFFKK